MENDGLSIDTRVGMGLHAHALNNIEGIDDDVLPYIRPAVEAFETVVVELGNIHNLRELALKNGALTDEGRVLQVAAYADKRMVVVTRMIDAAHAGLMANIKQAETSLNAPLEATVAHPIAQEIRAHAKAMEAGERRAFLTSSIATNDKAALSALLAAPHYLSGLTTVEREHFTRLHREKAYPTVANRLAVMKRALALVEERGALVHGAMEKAIGADYRRIGNVRAKDNRMKAALAK